MSCRVEAASCRKKSITNIANLAIVYIRQSIAVPVGNILIV